AGSLRLCKSAVLHFCHNVSPSLGITLTGSLRLCKSAVLHFCHNVSPSLGITLTGSLRLCKSAVLHFCHFIAHFSGSFAQKCIIKTVMAIRLWQQLAPGITGFPP